MVHAKVKVAKVSGMSLLYDGDAAGGECSSQDNIFLI